MRSISGQKIETATLPVYLDTYNEMSIVRMQHPAGGRAHRRTLRRVNP